MGDTFHDKEALEALTEQIVEVLRPIGLTVEPQMVQYAIQQGQMMVQMVGLVRPQAKERAEEDKETKIEFNQMMAEQNRLMQAEKRAEIEELAGDRDKLEKFLFETESDCSHEEIHEGLCLDCHAIIEEDS